MSRDPYRSSAGDLGYTSRGGQRWDSERFASERDRRPLYGEQRVDRFEERDVYDRRGSGTSRFEDERLRERVYYDEPEEPRFAREPRRPRGESITIEREKEREYYASPSPPRRAPARPSFLRRQSSLDTFDRKPMYHDEYGPPARRPDFRPEPFVPVPLPRSRALGPPPRRYVEREREFDDIKIAEPDYYGDEEYRGFPERVREREIYRSRPARRSRSRESKARASSISSSRSSSSAATAAKSEFPKRGKTRMPAKLVNKRAIIALGYPFEEEVDVIIIQKALGRDNIDEVIKLSEEYKKAEMSGGRGEIIEERRTEEVFEVPDVHEHDVVQKTTTTIERREVSPARTSRSHSSGPVPHIVHAERREYVERPNEIPIGPLVLIGNEHRHNKDERAIRAEIKALEAEKEAIRAEKRADIEFRRADRFRRDGRDSEELILYEERSERREPEGVRVVKDKKGRMSMSVPRKYR